MRPRSHQIRRETRRKCATADSSGDETNSEPELDLASLRVDQTSEVVEFRQIDLVLDLHAFSAEDGRQAIEKSPRKLTMKEVVLGAHHVVSSLNGLQIVEQEVVNEDRPGIFMFDSLYRITVSIR